MRFQSSVVRIMAFGRMTAYGVLAVACGMLGTACGNDSPVALRTSGAGQIWSLTINARALTLGVGDTYQLDATTRSVTGDTLSGVSDVVFVSSDTSKVAVTSGGLVTALDVTAGTPVVASVTDSGVTTSDTITVVVTATTGTFKTFSIQPYDGTSMGIGDGKYLSPSATDDADVSLYGIAVRFGSSDTTVATVTSMGYVSAKAKGTVDIWAVTTTYGITRTDTVVLTVTNPTLQRVAMYGSVAPTLGAFYPATQVIGAGGTVTWYNYTGAVSSITFETGVDDVPGGSISTIPSYGNVSRTFPVLGTYQYKDSLGNVGYVYVVPE
jgi:hypothetical protein